MMGGPMMGMKGMPMMGPGGMMMDGKIILDLKFFLSNFLIIRI